MSISTKSGFMKPMVHCPDMAILKSPKQTMLEQLGLEGEDLQHQTSSSDSEYEGETTKIPVFPSQSETTALKQMLRVTQRKLHLAQSNLADCEQNRERRLKIIRKTHQSALALKQTLIQELQDIVAEKDEIINSLNTKLQDSQVDVKVKPCMNESENGLQKLIEQVIHQQKEYISLMERYELVSEELKHSVNEKDTMWEELVRMKDIPVKSSVPTNSTKCHLSEQVRGLRWKVAQLEHERSASLSRRDTVEELQIMVVDLKSQLNILNQEMEKSYKEKEEANAVVMMLESVNEELKAEIAEKDLEISKLQSLLKEEITTVSSFKHKQKMEQDNVANLSNECSKVKSTLQLSEEKVSYLLKVVCEFETNEKKIEEECQELKQQLQCTRMQLLDSQQSETKDHVKKIKSSLEEVSISLCGIKKALTSIRYDVAEFITTIHQDMSIASNKICRELLSVTKQNSDLVLKYRREMALRKKLHNKIVDLKGNIRVFCRIRPVIAEDRKGSSASVAVEIDTEDDGILRVLNRNNWRSFEMDKVFGPFSSQDQVFSEVKELVMSSTDGYNICIFAYGQTGSGKTFTMEGTPDNPGISQRALVELFDIVKLRHSDWDYSIVVSVLEVYNESVRDLLSVKFTEKMDIKQGPEGVYVPGLTQVSVTCLEEINEVFTLGHKNRSTGATKMNIHSSRSHALLCVTVMGVCRTTGLQICGKLNLIDLAGSERVAKSGSDGDRLQEAKHINRSLSALGDVIHSLKSKSSHIPYRNSKLTHLLQDSLGGDSKTLMVVQIAPVERDICETVCSLNFAQRVRAVELGPATKRTLGPASEKLKTKELS